MDRCPNCQTPLTDANLRWVDENYDNLVTGPENGAHAMCSGCVGPATENRDVYGRLKYGSPECIKVDAEAEAWFETHIKPRGEEYRGFLKAWILKSHEGYVKRAHLLKDAKKLRRKDVQGELDWLWSDAIWCGDITTGQCVEEFYQDVWEEKTGYKKKDSMHYHEAAQEWLNEQFDTVFRAVMPKELHHVLEG